MRPVRVAVLGGGLRSAVGRAHASAIRMDPGFEVVAGCFSRDSAVNLESATMWGLDSEHVFANLEDLVSGRASVDAVVILTPTPDHFDGVSSVMSSGLNCISEKALAETAAQVDSLALLARERDRQLIVTYNYAGYPMLRVIRRLIADGRLGEIGRLEVRMPQEGFLRVNPVTGATPVQPWRAQDGPIPTVSLDLGVHVFHLVGYLVGKLPQEVVAVASHRGHVSTVIDSVLGLARLANGIDVSFSYGKDFLGQRNGLSVSVMGSEASVTWHQVEPDIMRWAQADGTVELVDRGSPKYLELSDPRFERFKAGHPTGFVEAFANLYADIRKQLSDPLESFDRLGEPVSGVGVTQQIMATLEAVHAASRERGWVEVSEPTPIARAVST